MKDMKSYLTVPAKGKGKFDSRMTVAVGQHGLLGKGKKMKAGKKGSSKKY